MRKRVDVVRIAAKVHGTRRRYSVSKDSANNYDQERPHPASDRESAENPINKSRWSFLGIMPSL